MGAAIRSIRLPELFLGLLSLAIAVVVVAHVFARTIHDAKHAQDTVTVTGSGVKPIDADLVRWTLLVADEGVTLPAAAARLRRDLGLVRAFLRKAGIGAASEQLSVVSTETLVERRRGRPVRRTYRVAQWITIQTRKLNVVERLATRAGDLLEQGVDVLPDPPEYVSTELRRAKLDALQAATADARQRAETLVDGLGGRLGRLRATSLGVYQITPRFSTNVADYGISDTSSREKDVRAVLSATFEVED